MFSCPVQHQSRLSIGIGYSATRSTLPQNNNFAIILPDLALGFLHVNESNRSPGRYNTNCGSGTFLIDTDVPTSYWESPPASMSLSVCTISYVAGRYSSYRSLRYTFVRSSMCAFKRRRYSSMPWLLRAWCPTLHENMKRMGRKASATKKCFISRKNPEKTKRHTLRFSNLGWYSL
jgi:hypothetical protein